MSGMTEIMKRTAKYGSYKRKKGEEVELVHLTPQAAAKLMVRLAPKYRTPWEKLNRFVDDMKKKGRFFKSMDLEDTLIRGMCENHPDKAVDSIKKNVSNWKKYTFEKNIKRDYCVEMCFIFGLDPDEADLLMTMLNDEGFHWRNPEDIIYLFALDNRLTYPEALSMIENMKGVYNDVSAEGREESGTRTEVVKREVKGIQDEEGLAAYFRESSQKLGSIRNTAYEEFVSMMETLKNPNVAYIEDEKEANRRAQERMKDVVWAPVKSKEEIEAEKRREEKELDQKEIVTRYMYRNIIPVKERKKRKSGEKVKYERAKHNQQESVIHVIGESWPNDSTISSMMTRSESVSRKVIILLALATDFNETYDDGLYGEPGVDSAMFSEDVSAAEQFEKSVSAIDDMLVRCGFGKLDPRSPFDWMVLYALGAGDALDIDRQIVGVLGQLFDTGNKEEAGKEGDDTL